MDRLEFVAGLESDGFSMIYTSLKPNLRKPDHCHDYDTRLLVLGGEITFTRNNAAETYRAGQCCEVLAGCMHAESVGLQGAAYIFGRRPNRNVMTREAFESDLRREGFEVVHGDLPPGLTGDVHAHDSDVRILVLSGEITVARDDWAETFQAGDLWEIRKGCQHSTEVGPRGVAYIAGKASRDRAR